jgi:hypothetical protein
MPIAAVPGCQDTAVNCGSDIPAPIHGGGDTNIWYAH